MSDQTHDRVHRTRYAPLFLAAAGVLQRIGDAAVIWFTFSADNQILILRGVAIGSLLCTSVLLIGVWWRRLRWARYVLTGFNWGYITLFGFCGLQGWNAATPTPSEPYLALIAGVLLYAAANVILVRSRRVRHFANL